MFCMEVRLAKKKKGERRNLHRVRNSGGNFITDGIECGGTL